MTLSDSRPEMLRGVRIEMYWDGAAAPAVSSPLGDFFCHGLGRMTRFENALFSSPEGRSFNCFVPMPFRTGMKIVLTNETDTALSMVFYDIDYTLNDKHGAEMLYFHSVFCRENPTTIQKDFTLLPRVEGRGRFIGANVGVKPDQERYMRSWWGEGEVKVFLDGDTELPTLSGTGTEDYLGTGWGLREYVNAYQGCHVADTDKFAYCFYRFHVPDPVYFGRDVRVTIQQIGCWDPESRPQMHALGRPVYRAGEGLVPLDLSPAGEADDFGLFERQDDWSSCVYFYLDRPENNLPPLMPVTERIAGLEHE